MTTPTTTTPRMARLVDPESVLHLAAGLTVPALCGLPAVCLDDPALTDGDLIPCPMCALRCPAVAR